MDKQEALDFICEVALDWGSEYGFSNPEDAKKVVNAVNIINPKANIKYFYPDEVPIINN